MPGLFLPRRWTRQPQGPVEVDLNHPIGGKIHYAYCPWENPFGTVPGKKFVVCSFSTGAAGATQSMTVAGRMGVSLNMHRSGSYQSSGIWIDDADTSNPLAITGTVSGGSIFTLVDGLSFYSSSTNLFGRFRLGGDYLGLTSTDRYFYLNTFSGVRGTGTVSVPEGYSGSMSFNFIGGGGSTSGKFYLGRALAYDANHGGYSVHNWRGWRGVTFDSPTFMRFPFSFRSDLLTEEEVFALDESPWQVLKPRRPIIYSLPSVSFQFARPSSDILVGAWQGVAV